jgi:hypothetical protein
MNRKLLIVLIAFLCFFSPSLSLAQENNQFGIHVTQIEDLPKAADLVNSSGGDWGYITIVIQENDRDFGKWQNFFNACRELHLIPLVRLATHLDGEIWKKPTLESINDWANFLDSLNWPVQNQYVIIFNEPNHTKEWGGEVNPEEYALILAKAITVFKQINPDFQVLNAGLDQAAPNSKTTIDELAFLSRMNAQVPEIFSRLDGWVSHSYPNHGYVGKPWEKGKGTIKGYEWELSLLKNSFGLTKELPVFITETGWPFNLDSDKTGFYDQGLVTEYTLIAFNDVWLQDEKIKAITPFILNYPYPPFANFSWLDPTGNPYSQYEAVKKIVKTKGEPFQWQKYEIVYISSPSLLPTNFVFKGKVILKNTGQSIWGEKPFLIKSQESELKLSDLALAEDKLIKPGEKAEFDFTLESASEAGEYLVSWEDLPQHKLKVFEIWDLTSEKNSLFNRFLTKIINLYYRLKIYRLSVL